MSLLQLWGLLRKHWLLLVCASVLGLAAAGAYSWTQPRLYAATSTGYVVAGGSATVGDALAGKNLAAEKAETYLPLVGSRSVAERIAEELERRSLPASGARLSASVDGVIFKITATSTSGELAAEVADMAIRATSIQANELETLTVSGESNGKTVVRIVPVEPAVTPSQPVSPQWQRNLLLGLLLGLLAGIGFLVTRQAVDRRVRLLTDAEGAAEASGLGIVPVARELREHESLAQDRGAAAEALRQLRTNLRFVSVDDPARSIVITSSNQSEGKSTIAGQLASLLAEAGEPTVLIDADLRRPMQATNFGVDGAVGLSQVLTGSVAVGDALVVPTSSNLKLLPAGRIPPNPSELLGSAKMKQLIADLSVDHMVLVDAPPLLPVTDSALLAVATDGVLIVVHSGKTRVEQLDLAAKKVRQVEGKVLGVVLNMVRRKDLGAATFGYGYGSYTSQYYAEDAEAGRRRAPRGNRRRGREVDAEATGSDDPKVSSTHRA